MKINEAVQVLTALQFGSRQKNETAACTLLALLSLGPNDPWKNAQAPLCGITPIIKFIAEKHKIRYAPNTRETIRDDAVKYFVEEGLLLRNPDNPERPTNSGKTVYQIEPSALVLLRKFKTPGWTHSLAQYLASRESLKHEIRPMDGKRRKEFKDLFAGCKAGLVFVTAFETRRAMQKYVAQIAWESEVWIAEDPDHMIHFKGERFLGPYPDAMPNHKK